jgi:hypothetical protein
MELQMSSSAPTGIPPHAVTTALRIEGIVALVTALAAYQALSGNWWVFAALILVPDLSMVGFAAGPSRGARIYNLAHTYTAPALLGALAYLIGAAWLLPVAIIWVAHIGADRALGYGLKYDAFGQTHLGVMGNKKKRSAALADAS